jgi:hypothetical protein
MIQNVAALSAAQTANPSLTPGQLASQVLGATPQQAQTIDGEAQVSQGQTGKSGSFVDIAGDLFEAFYPFLMFGLAAILFLVALFLAAQAISKSGTVKSAIQGATAGGAAGLASKLVK